MGRVRVSALAAILAIMSCCAALAATSTATASLQAAVVSHSCADVLFIGARGSGEPGPGTPGWNPKKNDPFGLGGTVDSAYRRLLSDLGGHRTVAVFSLNYGADSAITTLPRAPHKYFNDLSTGVSRTLSKLTSLASSCPDQQIVLAGFSQGAMVMHRVLHTLYGTVAGRRILARLAAAILVGDGDQVPHDNEVRYGTAGKGADGIGHLYTKLSHSTYAKFPASLGAQVLRVCNHHDPICDITPLAPWDPLLVNIHLSYPGSKPLLAAADRAAQDVRAVPLPTPRAVILSFTPGAPFHYQLQADVEPGYSLQWTVVPPEVMPAGLALSTSGLISGIPKRATSSVTLIRVRSVRKGSYSTWSQATVSLQVMAQQWTVTDAPAPDNAEANQPVSLGTVACPSVSWCVAVGGYTDTSGLNRGLLASGPPSQPGAWSAIEDPLPANADPTFGSGADSMACSSAQYCVAIGSYVPSANSPGSTGLLLTWMNGTWTPVQAPLPAGAYTVNGQADVSLTAVSCAAATSCVVTGNYYVDAAGDTAPMVLTSSGRSWSVMSAPLPSGVTPNSALSLDAVACGSPASCVAVGGGTYEPFVLAGSGTTWHAVSVRAPGDYSTSAGDLSLNGVACAAATSCVADGEYPAYDSSTGVTAYKAFVVTESGPTWTAKAAPLPPDAGNLQGTGVTDSTPLAITCHPAGACIVGGYYATNELTPGSTVIYRGFLDTWSGSSWVSAQALVSGRDQVLQSDIDGLACPSAVMCVGVGWYESTATAGFLLDTGTGTTWTAQPVATPAGTTLADYGINLYAVACSSPSACVATGWYGLPPEQGTPAREIPVLVTGPR